MLAVQMSEVKTLEANLDARLSVAGAARVAVEQMNAHERKGFENSCAQRRSQLLSKLAWDFRQLLCLQQTVLTNLRVPGFEGPTVDSAALDFQSRICSLLHTAFFLRKNLGEGTHKATLKSSAAKLKRDVSNRSPVPRGRTPPRSPVRTPPRSPVPPSVVPHHLPPPIYGGFQQPPPPPVYAMRPPGYPPIQQQPPPPIQSNVQQNRNMQMMAPGNTFGYQPPPTYY